jgi:hypothetical protein
MIQKVPEKIPASPQTFIDLLRMHLDIAFDENIVYLEINYRKAGDSTLHSISIVT